MLHYRKKNHWKQLFYRLHMYMHFESTSPSPRLLWITHGYWLSYRLRLRVTGTCVYKTHSSHQVPESEDTFLQSAFLRPFAIVWWKPQSSNLPISCFKLYWYHKINLAIPQRWQNSLLFFFMLSPCSWFCCSFATMTSDLWSWANQSGSRRHMTCKMAGEAWTSLDSACLH